MFPLLTRLDRYETNIWDIRALYGANMNAPLTELEVLTGSIFNKTGKPNPRQKDSSIKMKSGQPTSSPGS